MWTIMYRSVSSTLVTACDFNPSCFLMNVSMSTSIPLLSGPPTAALKRLDEARIQAGRSEAKLLHLKLFNLNYTFGRGARKAPENIVRMEQGKIVTRYTRLSFWTFRTIDTTLRVVVVFSSFFSAALAFSASTVVFSVTL
jgi:hypothetical protein